MKKICLIITIILCLLFAGCVEKDTSADERMSIVCTAFPQYDIVKNLCFDVPDTDITLIASNGTDIHSYQPSAADIIRISEADLVICIGGESDKWAREAAKNANVNAVLLTESVPGAQEHSHEANTPHNEHDHEALCVYDAEHIWLSVKDTIAITEKIKNVLCSADNQNSEAYIKNAAVFSEALSELDKEFEALIREKDGGFVVVADRFPFSNLFCDYGIGYEAAFPGCSAETDAGFDTVIRLSGAVKEHGLSHIAVCENSDKSLAVSVAENAGLPQENIVTLHSLQSVTENDLENGTTYISLMRENLEALKLLLG